MARFFASPAPGPAGPYYMMYNGSDSDGPYQIGAATSTDGATWTKWPLNPIITPGTSGSWDDEDVKDPYFTWDGSQYVCYYSGNNGTTYGIGRATAPAHTGPWTKTGQVLSVGTSGNYDDQHVSYPVVLYEPADTGKEWKMWFSAVKASDGIVRIGYATSTDGETWTKFGQVLDRGAVGQWDRDTVGPAGIVTSAGTYYLYYHGWSAASKRAGLVTFTDPEGTYTRDAGNPLFQNRALSKTLGANTLTGSASVTLNNTTTLQANEPVVLVDPDVPMENNVIASIDSGTTLTLERVVTHDFSSGQILRSFLWFGVGVRSMVRIGGEYVMFGSPFQPAEDLSPSGSKLREGNIRFTASALTGPWSPDFTTGEIFALYPYNTTSWDSISAENLCVIAAP